MITPLSNSKGHEKCDRLLVSKVEFGYQIFRRKNSIGIDPVFSNLVHFMKNLSIINCSGNSKRFEAINFFLQNSMAHILSKIKAVFFLLLCVHYSFPTVSWLCFVFEF